MGIIRLLIKEPSICKIAYKIKTNQINIIKIRVFIYFKFYKNKNYYSKINI